ncbi:hypothetical protein BH23GEM6_BH23GEM6_26730 [soil metagenome]
MDACRFSPIAKAHSFRGRCSVSSHSSNRQSHASARPANVKTTLARRVAGGYDSQQHADSESSLPIPACMPPTSPDQVVPVQMHGPSPCSVALSASSAKEKGALERDLQGSLLLRSLELSEPAGPVTEPALFPQRSGSTAVRVITAHRVIGAAHRRIAGAGLLVEAAVAVEVSGRNLCRSVPCVLLDPGVAANLMPPHVGWPTPSSVQQVYQRRRVERSM